MTKPRAPTSRQFVVDANVARAASDTDKPEAIICRRVLEALRDLCHRIVLSASQKVEWDRHASAYSRRWLVSMAAKRKFYVLRDPADAVLREAVNKASPDHRIGETIKDEFQVEMALATDLRILSADEKARKDFAALVEADPRLEGIHWLNPFEGESLFDWLEQGAPDDLSRCLKEARI